MPVHGNWPLVRRALDALRPEIGDDRELVLVDDASPEEAAAGLGDAVGDAVVIRNERNLGFGPSCNRGAEAARGTYLCFLNSDALVEPRALDELERVAEADGEAAVTAFLVAEDGTLQEAGRTVGRDVVTYPLGHGAAADDPRWAFQREVDYGSAACLLVRSSQFHELGGFDDAFAPGYHEDADFCLRLADRGGRTVVAPGARVVHLEHGSSSVSRARELVRRNVPTLAARWGSRFAHRPIVVALRPWMHRQLALRDAITLSRFLVFDDEGAAKHLARRWRGARVTLVGATPSADDAVETAAPDDVAEWLEARRFHYSVVVGADEALAPMLDRSQPQAVRVKRIDEAELVRAGIAPPGEEPRG